MVQCSTFKYSLEVFDSLYIITNAMVEVFTGVYNGIIFLFVNSHSSFASHCPQDKSWALQQGITSLPALVIA